MSGTSNAETFAFALGNLRRANALDWVRDALTRYLERKPDHRFGLCYYIRGEFWNFPGGCEVGMFATELMSSYCAMNGYCAGGMYVQDEPGYSELRAQIVRELLADLPAE